MLSPMGHLQVFSFSLQKTCRCPFGRSIAMTYLDPNTSHFLARWYPTMVALHSTPSHHQMPNSQHQYTWHTTPSQCVLRLCLNLPVRWVPACFWQVVIRCWASPASTGRTLSWLTCCHHHMVAPPHRWPHHIISLQWVVQLCLKRPETWKLEVVVGGGFLSGRVGGRTTTQNQLGMFVSGYRLTALRNRQMQSTREWWRGADCSNLDSMAGKLQGDRESG